MIHYRKPPFSKRLCPFCGTFKYSTCRPLGKPFQVLTTSSCNIFLGSSVPSLLFQVDVRSNIAGLFLLTISPILSELFFFFNMPMPDSVLHQHYTPDPIARSTAVASIYCYAWLSYPFKYQKRRLMQPGLPISVTHVVATHL